ncbi:MAG TPA: nuclear transport factor 2 family protein [Baekduia sp.]|nr:nuclear transport factor 2 family protein [Baekduia sp.]
MTAPRYLIEELLGRYAWAHDERDFDALAELFTEDARYEMRVKGGESHEQVGPVAIVGQIREFKERYTEQRRHVITNFRYDEETEDRAVVRSYLTVLHIGADRIDVVTAGIYRDEVVLRDGRWRIVAKSLELEHGF